MNRRLLLVHAHPDDECIGTGATMAKYVSEGAQVTLVTCTLGEEGEVLLPELSHLASDQGDALGEHRREELAAAMAELGVTDWRLLGGPGRFRDSGMVGTPPNERPDCFWRTDLLVAALELVPVIRELRPQVVVTYDEFGGYGHPDHIQAHRVTHYAIALAENATFRPDLGPVWQVAKVYWTAFPRSIMRAGIEAMRAQGEVDGFAAMDPDDIPFACDDALVTTQIDGRAFLPNKMAALRAHGTQVSVDGGFFALADNVGAEVFGTEFFRLVRGTRGAAAGSERETDLFAGIAEVILRLLGGIGLFALGVLLGLVGAFVQAQRSLVDTPWGVAVIPWGVAIVWVTLLIAIRAGAWSLRTRWGSWTVLAGWLAATVAMAAESASGDLALSGGTRQLVYLFGGVIMGSAAATLPLPASDRPTRKG